MTLRLADTGQRCFSIGGDPLMIAYYDDEWGTPCHDDRKLFELLMLEVN
jgi:DNA-3-methyladenine glycosylase I